jgi:heat shock protein HtpX
MFAFFVVIIALGWSFSYIYGNPVILYGAVALSIFMNIGGYWYSDKLALATSGAHPIGPEHRELERIVENLSIASGMPKPKVYIINDPAPNAFATGRDPAHGTVAVTTGLLSILDKTELEGVIGHELSHIKNRDTLVMTVVVVLVGFVALLSDFFLRAHLLHN